MRTANCPLCNQRLEAENDQALFEKGKAHAAEAHAGMNLSDERVQQVIDQSAKDA